MKGSHATVGTAVPLSRLELLANVLVDWTHGLSSWTKLETAS